MIIERKCLTCRLSAENPDLSPDEVLQQATQGPAPRLCLAHPPTFTVIPTQHGPMMTPLYPAVTITTISCADYEPEFLNG